MDSTTTVTQDPRAEQVANLRAFADFLEANPHLRSPFDTGQKLLVYVGLTEDPKLALAAWARAATHLNPTKDYGDGYARLLVPFGKLILQVYADREQVCERVVTGVRQVTETVKDPEMLAAVPEVEVTREVEDVEWICRPLLAVDEQAMA